MTLRRLAVLCFVILLAMALPLGLRAQEGDALGDALPASALGLVPLTGVTDISAGLDHSCAVADGGVWCWGWNFHGQIGDGTAIDRLWPVNVIAPGSGVTQVAAGAHHTCALFSTGTVNCWGRGDSGELGDGNSTTSTVPVAVGAGLGNVASLAAGDAFTCAARSVGDIWCWGSGSWGKLGNGSVQNMDLPSLVSGSQTFVAVDAGDTHACAISDDELLYCWGGNAYGQLGDSTLTNRNVPKLVFNESVRSVALGGYHTCIDTVAGPTWCWGYNNRAQLGDGTTISRSSGQWVDVLDGPATAEYVAAGHYTSCALTFGGGIYCWGDNSFGALGNGAPIPEGGNFTLFPRPAPVLGLTHNVVDVDGGGLHTCAVTSDGLAWCWGYNAMGQLGDITRISRSIPSPVLVPATCYKLTLAISGSGGTPAMIPDRTDGCPHGHFIPGAAVQLSASPMSGQRVQAWGAPALGAAGSLTGQLRMPAADTTVNIAYGSCYALTRTKTGSGGLPEAAPAASPGCPTGSYGAGESIVMVAVPAASQRVQAWSGTTAAPAIGSQVNTLTMPNAARTVSVAYEACFALSAAIVGSGSLAEVTPSASSGCVEAATFAAGEQVTLRAQPAVGYVLEGWAGSCTGTAVSCQYTVDGPGAVTATFVRQQLPVAALPAVSGEGSVKIEVVSLPTSASSASGAAATQASAAYPYGTRLRLTASAAPGFQFTGWEGSVTGTTNPTEVLVTAPLDIRARFEPVVGPPARAYLPIVQR